MDISSDMKTLISSEIKLFRQSYKVGGASNHDGRLGLVLKCDKRMVAGKAVVMHGRWALNRSVRYE